MNDSHSDIAPPNSESVFPNYFELLKLPVSFTIDQKQLVSHYQAIQMQVHPDHFATDSAQQQRLALQYASQVNEAYQTLLNPGKRAVYLLTLISGDEHFLNSVRVSPAFLQEQMELHEALALLPSIDDAQARQLQYSSFIDDLEKKRQGMIDTLTTLFSDTVYLFANNAQCGRPVDADIKEIAAVVQQYSYITKLMAEAKKQANKI